MISYGGISLPLVKQAHQDWIDKYIPASDVHQWMSRLHPVDLNGTETWTDNSDAPRGIKLGTLYWPNYASRWAVAYFLVTEDQLDVIRRLAYTSTESDRYKALPLIMGSGKFKIKTDMYMLPARPLAQLADADLERGEHKMYLLTLVDERWYWWEKSSSIVVTAGTTTWADLFSSIGTALGVTITTDTISSNYLKPTEFLTQRYGYIPLLLDAACSSIGHLLCRKLDGTVITQTPRTALASEDSQFAKYDKIGGGSFELNR